MYVLVSLWFSTLMREFFFNVDKVIYGLIGKIYDFEEELKQKHPDNNFVKDKLRQQLQILRDKGYIEFIRRGHYKKII